MRVLYLFSQYNFENFDILHAFLGLTVTKLSSLKTVRFFWPTLYTAAGFMTHVTCRLTVKNRDQLLNPTVGNRVWAAL